jgi:hypothetical protein
MRTAMSGLIVFACLLAAGTCMDGPADRRRPLPQGPLAAKERVARRLVAGQLTLPEAVARFREINGDGDDEAARREVIRYWHHGPDQEEAAREALPAWGKE